LSFSVLFVHVMLVRLTLAVEGNLLTYLQVYSTCKMMQTYRQISETKLRSHLLAFDICASCLFAHDYTCALSFC